MKNLFLCLCLSAYAAALFVPLQDGARKELRTIAADWQSLRYDADEIALF